MDEYDLTRTIFPYLDRRLVFPLLSHLHESGLFSPEQVATAQYELAKGANMVDYIVTLYEQLNDSEAPQGVKSQSPARRSVQSAQELDNEGVRERTDVPCPSPNRAPSEARGSHVSPPRERRRRGCQRDSQGH